MCEWSDPNISWFVFSPGPGWHKYYRSWIKLHQLPPQQSRSGLYMKCFSVSQSINLSCLVCFAIFAKNSWPSLCEKCNVLKAVWAESWHLSSSKNSFIESIFLEPKIVRGRQITTAAQHYFVNANKNSISEGSLQANASLFLGIFASK